MNWDWDRVNPKGGMTATMAKTLVAVQLLLTVSSLLNASRSSGATAWVSLAVAVVTLSVAVWVVVVASGILRRS